MSGTKEIWPRDRYIELAPRYWRITRARLDPEELELELGWLTIPEFAGSVRQPRRLPARGCEQRVRR